MPAAFNYRRNRKNADPSNLGLSRRRLTPTPSIVATKLRLTFECPVSCFGLPAVGLTGGLHTGTAFPTSFVLIAPNVVELDYLAAVAAGDVMTIESGDQCIRSYTGATAEVLSKILA